MISKRQEKIVQNQLWIDGKGRRERYRKGVDVGEGEGVGSSSHSHPPPHFNAKELLNGLALLVDGQKKMR